MFEIFLSNSSTSGFVELHALALLVVDEIRRQVTAIELHAFDDIQLVLQSRSFLNRDDAFLADLLHRLGDDLADLRRPN